MKKLLTEEQRQRRAETARRNGAKSKGPVTAEGKHRSSMNAISVGAYVEVHSEELPPSARLLTADDRKTYVRLHQGNLRHYRPQSETELSLVRNITIEQFEYERYRHIETQQLQSEHDDMRNEWPEVPPEQLSAYAIEYSVRNQKVHRFIERKMKGHLAAWTKFVALYEKLRKARPVAEARNEPSVTSPEPVAKSIVNEQHTEEFIPSGGVRKPRNPPLKFQTPLAPRIKNG